MIPAPPPRRCTIRAYERWTREHAHRGRIPQRDKPAMWRLEACLDHRHGARVRLTAIRQRMRILRAQAWSLTHPWQTAVASWYVDAGQTASGFHAAYGFAACGSTGPCLPFGTRVEFCLDGRCVIAERDDSGPFVAGRNFDLGTSTAQALGFSGVQTIRWREAR